MDLRFLETFVTVADCGSLAQAARRLNITPAAVSQRLQTLEQDLGHSLVVRVGRSVRPTASGLAVLAPARALLEASRDLRAIAAQDEPAGQLRLGAIATSLTGILPEVIADLRSLYPKIDYFVRPASSLDLYHAVIAGDLDAAIMVEPPFAVPKSTGWLTLREEAMVLLVPEAMPEASPHEILTREPFIRYDRNQWGGHIVERYLQSEGIKTREWIELDALDAIAGFVHRGLGVAIVPDWAPPWPEGLRLRKIALAGAGGRRSGVLWTRSGPRLAALEAFVQACERLKLKAAT